jgi:hypothetical protein
MQQINVIIHFLNILKMECVQTYMFLSVNSLIRTSGFNVNLNSLLV